RLADLSPPWQSLVRLFQRVNFGEVQRIHVRNAVPVMDDEPVILISVKLDRDNDRRPECDLDDFALRQEVLTLIAELQRFSEWHIATVEIREGIPRRLVFESKMVDLAIPHCTNPPAQSEARGGARRPA